MYRVFADDLQKLLLLASFNKCLYNGKSEIKVNINKSNETFLKKPTTVGELVTAECSSVLSVYIYCT